jgi:hypothetical protein
VDTTRQPRPVKGSAFGELEILLQIDERWLWLQVDVVE